MHLHYAPGTVAISVAIALEEAGLAHEATALDFSNGDQRSADYLALNPKGRVPALITDAGVLTETGAILDYIGTRAPELVPADPFHAARMREAMYYLASTLHVAHAHKLRGARWADQPTSIADMQAKVPETMTACCAYLEARYEFAPFTLGQQLTLADPYMFVACGWATGDGVDMAAFPKLSAFLTMMRDRDSVQAVIAKGMLA